MSTPDDKPKVPASWQTITRVADEANAEDAAIVDELANLGDAAIQDALIANILLRHPLARIFGITLNPGDTEERHGVVSFQIAAGNIELLGRCGRGERHDENRT